MLNHLIVLHRIVMSLVFISIIGCTSVSSHSTDYQHLYDEHVILNRADQFFLHQQYTEAIQAYQYFLTIHPESSFVSYAASQIGDSYVELIPGIDRDLTSLHRAKESYQNVIRRFPTSWEAQHAQQQLINLDCLEAESILNIADFYMRRESWYAAHYRVQTVIQNYESCPTMLQHAHHLQDELHRILE